MSAPTRSAAAAAGTSGGVAGLGAGGGGGGAGSVLARLRSSRLGRSLTETGVAAWRLSAAELRLLTPAAAAGVFFSFCWFSLLFSRLMAASLFLVGLLPLAAPPPDADAPPAFPLTLKSKSSLFSDDAVCSRCVRNSLRDRNFFPSGLNKRLS